MENQTTTKKPKLTKCIICNNKFTGFGHNPAPLQDNKFRCCDSCHYTQVIPYRLYKLNQQNQTT
tara:strand:- start:29255 stop:29446 length:192 start_codon:yes stop_codon:yes gene_type:complete